MSTLYTIVTTPCATGLLRAGRRCPTLHLPSLLRRSNLTLTLSSLRVPYVFTYQGAYATNEPEAVPIVWRELLKLFDEKKIRGVVFDKVFQYVPLASFTTDKSILSPYPLQRTRKRP